MIALLLSAVGLYAVLSCMVAQRTLEIGLRLALGAQRDNVLGLILRRGLILAATGLAIGIVVALLLTQFMAGVLYRGETVRSCAVGFCQCSTFAGIASRQQRACVQGGEAGSHADAARPIEPIEGTGLKEGRMANGELISPGSARILRLEKIAREFEQGWSWSQ